MASSSGQLLAAPGAGNSLQRHRAPTITIQPAEDDSHDASQTQDSPVAQAAASTEQPASDHRHTAWPRDTTAGSRLSCSAHLGVPRPDLADPGRDSSCASTMSPSLSATRSFSISSCSTFPDDKPNDIGRIPHPTFVERTTVLSPKALAETVSSKSIAELEALGGLDGLALALHTDLYAGLSAGASQQFESEQIRTDGNDSGSYAARIETYGTNIIPPKKPKTIFELMYKVLCDKVLILLCTVAAMSLALGLVQMVFQPSLPGQPRIEWVDSLTIMAAVLVVVVTEAVNDYQKEKQFVKLVKKTEDRTVRAIRSGRPTEISVLDVVVGDILHVSAGSLVAADGVLITGHAIRCDESALTGESDQINKSPLAVALSRLSVGEASKDADPFMISGSKILEGTGTYLVMAVGVHSFSGRVKMSLEERTEETPLQKKLGAIAERIAVAGVAIAVLLFTALTIKLIVFVSATGASAFDIVQILLRIFMISISIVAVAVPEGLPLAVTLALAIGVTRMLKDNNLVRVLSACETMGNATVICSDKTGTLTMNRMSVVDGRVGFRSESEDRDDTHPQSTNDSSATQLHFQLTLSPQVRDILVDSIAANTSALETQEGGSTAFVGSSTETALLTFCRTWLGMRPLEEHRNSSRIKQVLPFDSARKYMCTTVELPNGTYRVYVKGAPEILLRLCSRVLTSSNGSIEDRIKLTNKHRESILKTISGYGESCLRTVGLAFLDMPSWQASDFRDGLSLDNMTLLGMLAIQDPVRPEVSDAVSRCTKAGVSVRMVTGDDVHIARAIAKDSGILTDLGLVMEGPRFRSLSSAELSRILPRLQVLARSSPEDKKMLVERLKEMGETVAVTGDGTNDGPALRAADVGFSMGISGTDVAREASSIILMDDNFSSILKAIEWGRSINDGIKKFLHFQLTANITAVTLTCISAICSSAGGSIMSPAQLLWINLIMDTLAALALATEPADSSVLERTPDAKSMPLIAATGWHMIIGQALYQLIVITVLSFAAPTVLPPSRRDGLDVLDTITFNTFVWMQVFNLFNNRRLDHDWHVFKGLHKNWFFITVSLVIVILQGLIVTFGGSALSTVPLTAVEWMLCISLGALCMPVAVLIRLIPDHRPRCFGNTPLIHDMPMETSSPDPSGSPARSPALRNIGRMPYTCVRDFLRGTLPGEDGLTSRKRRFESNPEASRIIDEQSPLLDDNRSQDIGVS